MFARTIMLSFVIGLLAGCGSGNPGAAERATPGSAPGGGSGDPYVGFEGIWEGTLTPEATMTSSWAIALVNGWGEFRLLTSDAQFVGFPRRTATELRGEVTGLRSPGTTWSDGTRVSPFTISGSIAGDFIDAAYAGSTGGGTMAMAWVAGIESDPDIAVRGMWALFDDEQNILATFEIRGTGRWTAAITGFHAVGCSYSGEMDSWTSSASYDIAEFAISGCPLIGGIDMNGAYSGTAAQLDVAHDGTDEPALVVALSNDETQLTYFLYRL